MVTYRPPELEGQRQFDERIRIERLASVFYDRIEARRFNSIATYKDPALREYFRTPQAFDDYYAELVQDLTLWHFEAVRPTRVVVLDMALEESGRVGVRVRFHGRNGRPMRFWNTSLIRIDQWEFSDGRWWILPGKV